MQELGACAGVFHLIEGLRGLLLALVLVVMDNVMMQLTSLIVISMAMMVVVGGVEFHNRSYHLRTLLFDEYIVNIINYHLMYSTSFLKNPSHKTRVGWSLIFFTVATILLRLLSMTSDIVKEIAHSCRLSYLRRQGKKRQAKKM